MELRRIMAKRRANRKTGTLSCSKCKIPGHFVLWEDDLCKRCHTLRPARLAREATREAQSIAAKANHARKKAIRKRADPWPQTERTLQLRLEVDRLCTETSVSRREMARRLHLNESRFDGWYYGSYGPEGQRRMNLRVSKAIQENFQPMEEAVA